MPSALPEPPEAWVHTFGTPRQAGPRRDDAVGGAVFSALTLRPSRVTWASLDLPEPDPETSLGQTLLGLPVVPRMWPGAACQFHLASFWDSVWLGLFSFGSFILTCCSRQTSWACRFPGPEFPQPGGSCLAYVLWHGKNSKSIGQDSSL